MAINSKVEVCNMTLSRLGIQDTVTNIDTPTSRKEITFSLWYDVARENLLKLVMPNFALARVMVAKVVTTPAFGYKNVYSLPPACLKVLGIGNIEDKENNYNVEGNLIYTDDDYSTGMPVRFIKNISIVTSMSSEFKILLADYLAIMAGLELTKDVNAIKKIEDRFPLNVSVASGMNAQENMPVRKSVSRFRAARSSGAMGGLNNYGKK